MTSNLPTPVIARPHALRIAIAGAGALGSAILHHLMQSSPAWLASVLLIDPDHIEERNIAMSRLFQKAVISHDQSILVQPKADALSNLARDTADFPCEAAVCEIADVGWQRLRGVDLLLCCTDDALARVETAHAARALGLPLIDVGVFGGEELHRATARGRVTYFAPDYSEACALCGLREERRAELLSFAVTRTLGCRPLYAPESLGHATMPPLTIEATAAVTTAMMDDFIHNSATSLCYRRSWTICPAHGEDFTNAPRHLLTRSLSCPWHEEEKSRLIALPDDRPLRDTLLEAAPDAQWRMQFAWPMCVEACCLHCGREQRTALRVAALRRRGRCTHCDVIGTMEPRRILSSLGALDAESALTPMELGLPRGHMVRLRRAISFGHTI